MVIVCYLKNSLFRMLRRSPADQMQAYLFEDAEFGIPDADSLNSNAFSIRMPDDVFVICAFVQTMTASHNFPDNLCNSR